MVSRFIEGHCREAGKGQPLTKRKKGREGGREEGAGQRSWDQPGMTRVLTGSQEGGCEGSRPPVSKHAGHPIPE